MKRAVVSLTVCLAIIAGLVLTYNALTARQAEQVAAMQAEWDAVKADLETDIADLEAANASLRDEIVRLEAEKQALIEDVNTLADKLERETHEPVTPSVSGNVEQWRSLVARYWPGDVDEALTCIDRESGGDPNATNPSSGCAGLFQLAPAHWEGSDDPYDPATNVRIAARLYAESGWGPWVTMP